MSQFRRFREGHELEVRLGKTSNHAGSGNNEESRCQNNPLTKTINEYASDRGKNKSHQCKNGDYCAGLQGCYIKSFGKNGERRSQDSESDGHEERND